MKIRTILLLFSVCLAFFACQDETEIARTTTNITIKYPEIQALTIKSQTHVFTNISTVENLTIPVEEDFNLPEGIYNCSYKAEVTYQTTSEGATSKPEGDQAGDDHQQESETVTQEGKLSGKLESVEVKGNEKIKLTIETFLFTDKDDFIIQEVFFTGTLRATGSQYYGNAYVKVFNNTDHVLYADGLALTESKFKSSQYFAYTPDIRKDTLTVWAIYVVPGTGKEHPVQPGESLTLCDTGIDHRNANPYSFDLSHADFEWYDVSTQPAHMDIDSPTVPNLDKWYCYTLSFWVLQNRGLCSYALARIPVDKKTYLRDYYYTYDYTMYLPAGTFPMQQSAYKIPNTWIVDGVNCSVEAKRVWDILPANIDAGWTHCGKIDKDKTRYFKSVRRKVAGFDNERCILQDTNNSSDDFNTECVPSIIEEQGSVMDVQGTKATTVTWDGVMPKN